MFPLPLERPMPSHDYLAQRPVQGSQGWTFRSAPSGPNCKFHQAGFLGEACCLKICTCCHSSLRPADLVLAGAKCPSLIANLARHQAAD